MAEIVTNNLLAAQPNVSGDIFERTVEGSVILASSPSVPVKSEGHKIVHIGASNPQWVKEGQTKPINNVGISTVTLIPQKLVSILVTTTEAARDYAYIAAQFVETAPADFGRKFDATAIGQNRTATGLTVNADAVYSDGSPVFLPNYSADDSGTLGAKNNRTTVAAFGYDVLVDQLSDYQTRSGGLLPPNVWYVTDGAYFELLKVKDTLGHPLLASLNTGVEALFGITVKRISTPGKTMVLTNTSAARTGTVEDGIVLRKGTEGTVVDSQGVTHNLLQQNKVAWILEQELAFAANNNYSVRLTITN